MKIDARRLDHVTLEQIRLMAIRRIREGEDPGVVIASYGFNPTTNYKRMHLAAESGNGLRAMSSTRGTAEDSAQHSDRPCRHRSESLTLAVTIESSGKF